MNNFYLIGLTGNLASGKSTVRRMLEQLGAAGIDADRLAHAAMRRGSPAWGAIVDTFGTGTVEEERIAAAVRHVFGLKPRQIIEHLDLLRPIYQKTAAYGHFGRAEKEFTWERTDKKDALREAAGGGKVRAVAGA